MRSADVLFKNEPAGTLTQFDDGSFAFVYFENWVNNPSKAAISLTLPKRIEAYHSSFLFPFFYNLLPEGSNKETVCHHLQIDEDDYFGIMLATANHDTIGAVRLKQNEPND